MSLVIAEALPNCALLVSDTRGVRDDRPVTDEMRKIFPLPGGGFMDSGPGAAWGRDLYERLKDTDGTLDALVKATQEWAPAAMRNLAGTYPDMARLVREHQSTVVIGSDDNGLYAAEMDWMGAVRVHGPDRTIIGVPPLLQGVLPVLQDDYAETISQLVEANTAPVDELVDALLKHAAAFCLDMFQRCGPDGYIGPNIEAGVMIQTAPGVFKSLFVERTGAARYQDFSRVVAYRAIVRARSLRLGREQGLVGAALEARVNDDLAHAFDSEGRATLPEALLMAKKPAFNGPLPPDSFGQQFTSVLNNHIYTKFVVPFAKVSFNIFDYVWQGTPILNVFNSRARAIMLKGGEDAAVLHARSVLAGTLYAYAIHRAMTGDLTGRGPSNPGLRKEWLLTHKPYTLSGTDVLGNRYDIPFGRLDPLGMPFGLIGDLHQVISESPDSRDASDLATAIVASLAANLSSKSYLAGITQFADAWGSNDPHKTKRYMQDFVANMVVPNLVTDFGRQTGLDPYFHEVRTLGDAILNRLPSNSLTPRYDMFGRPVLRMIEPASLPKNPVENTLLTLDRALPPHPTTVANGLVDLLDPKYAPNGKPVPYVRLMQLIREGFNGNPGLRNQIVSLVNSDRWNQASDGSEQFPGGSRWVLANAIKTTQEQRAFNIVRQEYPLVDKAFRAALRARGMSMQEGQSGVAQVESLFNVQLKR